jgi:tripartite-type tricarboxylate transporter receptor subunit TctC
MRPLFRLLISFALLAATSAWSQAYPNRPGAGGMLGTGGVAKAEPDGYTIVLSSLSAYAIGPRLVKQSPDPINDFTAIGGVAIAPTILTVNATLPFQNLAQLMASRRRIRES